MRFTLSKIAFNYFKTILYIFFKSNWFFFLKQTWKCYMKKNMYGSSPKKPYDQEALLHQKNPNFIFRNLNFHVICGVRCTASIFWRDGGFIGFQIKVRPMGMPFLPKRWRLQLNNWERIETEVETFCIILYVTLVSSINWYILSLW